MRVATILLLTLFMLPLVQANSESSWSHEFEAGYISTQPLVVGDSVYVRTSGFWTGEERPHVAAFELQTGNEIWRYTSQTSLQHDMAPLLFVEAGSGPCGAWNDLLLVGWTDGKTDCPLTNRWLSCLAESNRSRNHRNHWKDGSRW